MGQLLKLLVIAAIVAFVIHKLRRIGADDSPVKPRPGKQGNDDKPMLACAQCGTYIPADNAIIKDNKAYCCEEHRDHP